MCVCVCVCVCVRVCVFVHTHIRIVLLTLVIWGRGIWLQHQLLDGALEKEKEEEEEEEEEEKEEEKCFMLHGNLVQSVSLNVIEAERRFPHINTLPPTFSRTY